MQRVAGHPAAKVPDAAATSYCPVKADNGVAAYIMQKSPATRQGFKLQTFDLVEKCSTQSVRFFIGFGRVWVVRDLFQYIAGLTMEHFANFVKSSNRKLFDCAKADCRNSRRSNPGSFSELLLGHICICKQSL